MQLRYLNNKTLNILKKKIISVKNTFANVNFFLNYKQNLSKIKKPSHLKRDGFPVFSLCLVLQNIIGINKVRFFTIQ